MNRRRAALKIKIGRRPLTRRQQSRRDQSANKARHGAAARRNSLSAVASRRASGVLEEFLGGAVHFFVFVFGAKRAASAPLGYLLSRRPMRARRPVCSSAVVVAVVAVVVVFVAADDVARL